MLEACYETYGDKLAAIADPRERLLAILDEFLSPEYHQLLDDRAFYACFYLSLTHPRARQAYATPYDSSLELVETAIRECMEAGAIPHNDGYQLAMTVKAMEEGYAFLIGGGADEADKATMGDVLKGRVLRLLGLEAA